jgi:4'-phosphopantetheinyl transferase
MNVARSSARPVGDQRAARPRGLPPRPTLAPHDVAVVRLALDGPVDLRRLEVLLDADERDRAAGLVHTPDRRRFIAAHGLMRIVLGRMLDQPPDGVRLERDAHGKPRLAGRSPDVRFNLSHSAGVGLLAVARGREVGVDIERQGTIAPLRFSGRFFSAAEHDALARLAPVDRLAAFYRCWTRKESFVKALGRGLAFPLDGFEVSVSAGRHRLLRACRAAPAEVTRWRMVSLATRPGYAAALTAAGCEWRVIRWALPTVEV